jgi:hypothetical protein
MALTSQRPVAEETGSFKLVQARRLPYQVHRLQSQRDSADGEGEAGERESLLAA